MPEIKIALMDDDLLDAYKIKQGFLQSSTHKIVHHFLNGIDAVNGFHDYAIDVLIADLHIPILNGYDTIAMLRNKGFKGKIIAVTHGFYSNAIAKAEQAGADGFCMKDPVKIQEILPIILSGSNYYDKNYYTYWENISYKNRLFEKDIDPKIASITSRDKKIILYSAQGLTSDEIAGKLSLKKHTVDIYRSSLIQKLGFSNICQVTAWAVSVGIITLADILPKTANF